MKINRIDWMFNLFSRWLDFAITFSVMFSVLNWGNIYLMIAVLIYGLWNYEDGYSRGMGSRRGQNG